MASWQDSVDQQMLDQERYKLARLEEQVKNQGAELVGVNTKINAANRILEEIEALAKVHPEEISSFDWQRAKAALPKLVAKRVELETQISTANRRIEVTEAGIQKFDLKKLERLQRIRNLFQQIAG